MKRIIIPSLLVLALAAGVGWWYRGVHAGSGAPPETVAVEVGDLIRTVTALGKLEPLQYVDVGAQISGQLEALHVQPGDQVRTGDLLAEMDATVFNAQVAADRATVAGLEAQLTERRASLRLADQQLRRHRDLYAANATSKESLDAAEAEAEAAKARVAALQADIQKARSTLEANLANLDYTQIRAPMDGTVMSVAVRQGQTISARQEAPIILQIADLGTMTVKAQVSEADVGKLRPGMETYFTTLGHPERRWTGALRQILPTPEVVNDVVLYYALFDVPNPDRRLMPQMTAQVFFVLGRAERALLVPVSALRPGAEPDSYVVQVLRDGMVESRPVTVGLQDRVRAEIVEGLAADDRVVVNPLRPGDRRRGNA